MAEALSLTCIVNTPYIPVTSQPRLVYLLLEVGGGADGASLPINLGLVVDTSESMHIRLATEGQFEELARMGILKEMLVDGVPAWQSADIPNEVVARLPRKIDRVKDALRAAVEQLRSSDRFSLVAFAGQAVTLVSNTSGSQKRRLLDAIEELDGLQLGDETYIARGIALGVEELRLGTSPSTAPFDTPAATQDKLGTGADGTSTDRMSAGEGRSRFATLRQAQGRLLHRGRGASSDLADRLLVFTDGFAFDEKECRAWAVRARQAHVPISTMGLGGKFNEELMIPIADRTGGEAYLLEDPDDIPSAFAQELQRAQAVRYRNLELKLRPSQGMEVRAAYRVRPSIAPLETADRARVPRVGDYSFPLGDLVAGEEPALLLEVIVPPRSAGIYRLAQALLACDDPAGNLAGLKTRADIVVEYTPDPARVAQRTAHVMHVVEALSAYKLQRRAQTDLEAGDVAGATRKLRAAATRLLDMGEEELAAEMEQQAEELGQRGQADSRRTKKLRYETRKLTRKSTRMDGIRG